MYALFLFVVLFFTVVASLTIGHHSIHFYRLKYDVNDDEFTSYISALTPYTWLRELLLRNPAG